MTHSNLSLRRKKFHHPIRDFFFSEETPYGLALTRIFLPIVLMVIVGTRWMHAREIYSTDGAASPIWVSYHTNAFLPQLSGILAVGLFSVLFVSLLTTMIGLCTRLSLGISTILYFYFNSMDMLSSMTKYSVIATHILLLLTLSRCGEIWSLDSLFRRRKRAMASPRSGFTIKKQKTEVWPQRLIQILIAVVYFGAAITKIHTPGFFSGEQMQQWMLTDVNYNNPFGEQTANFPLYLIISAYINLVWEIAFLFLIWNRSAKFFMLGVGVVFHLLTIILLGLYIFPAIYMVLYLSFLNENDVRKSIVFWKLMKRRLGFQRRSFTIPLPSKLVGFVPPVPTPVLLGMLLLVSGVIGITAEYFMDPYGLRREEGRYTIKKIDQEKVNRMLAPTRSIRTKDKIFDLQTGTVIIGGVIANPRKAFYKGETIVAQCTLNPPHEDMVLQCILFDKDEKPLIPIDYIVPREQNRCSYTFHITGALETGEYALVLKYRGEELLRKTITIDTGKNKVVAN